MDASSGVQSDTSGKQTNVKGTAATLPHLHWMCYTGNVDGVRKCLHAGDDPHALIDLPNQNGQMVIGVTPLYLAAQQGHLTVCQLLVEQGGADVMRQCCIPATGEVFGAADIALVHFNLRCWSFLSRRKQQRLAKLQRVQISGQAARDALTEPLVGDSDSSALLDC